jgi:hypothetical protein
MKVSINVQKLQEHEYGFRSKHCLYLTEYRKLLTSVISVELMFDFFTQPCRFVIGR